MIKQENSLMIYSTIIKYIKHYQNNYIYETLNWSDSNYDFKKF